MRVPRPMPAGAARHAGPRKAAIRGLLLALGLALALPLALAPLPSSGPLGSFGPLGTAAAQTAPGAAPPGPIEPTAPRVGHVRRNAQGVIELVPPPAAPAAEAPAPSVPPAAAPAPSSAPPPRSQPPARTAAPAGLPPAPVPLASPAPAASPGQAPQAAAVQASYERACPDSVLLCLGVLGGAGGAQDNVPVTFGHPLAPKLLQPGQRLVGRFNGATLPVQIDQVATHYDGSVRFAVFSLVLPRVPDRGPHTLELVPDATATLPTPPPIPPPPTDFRVEIEAYAAQVYEVKFGNRSGHTAGIPFQAGEVITLVVGEGAAQERFSVTVAAKLVGGGFESLSEIARAFVQTIARSPTYRAHQDVAEAYERFWVTSRARPGAKFPLKIEYGGQAKIGAKVVQPWEGRIVYSGALDERATSKQRWLDGPIAREEAGVVSLRPTGGGSEHPLLMATLAVRQIAGSRAARYEAVVENTFALPGGIRNVQYDIAVHANGRRVFEAKGVEHHAYARWRRIFYAEPTTEVVVGQDRKRLFQSSAVPSYDPQLRISEQGIAGTVDAYRKSDLGLLGAAMITRYMPMTGGRSDIGPLPLWSAQHVISQDPRLLPAVLGNGDASGAVPIHLRDRATGRMMNVAWFPDARLWGTLTVNGKVIEQGFDSSDYSVDSAHQPSLVYYPYLLTGERFYLDELHFWVSVNALMRRPDMRDLGAGLLREDQLRGQAWTLRSLGHAALITADAHPLKALFQKQLNANIAWYNKKFDTARPHPAGKLPAWFEAVDGETVMAPWQQDFMTIVLGQLAENDVPGARQLAVWMAGFGVGRFLAEGEGFCRAHSPGYHYKLRNQPSDPPPTTWAQLHRLNWPEQRSCAGVPWLEGPNPCTGCYTSIAAAALATFANLGVGAAKEPYDFIRTQTGHRNANFAADPTFAIVPRQR